MSLGDSLETGSETTEQAPDSVSLNSNPTFGQLVQQPKYCVALYSYQVSNLINDYSLLNCHFFVGTAL